MTIEDLLINFDFSEAPHESEVARLLAKFDFTIDRGYVNFITRHNGASGAIGEHFLMLWNIDDICALNPYYEPDHDDGYSSGLFFIGSNGGDAGYAIRKKDGLFIEVPFIGMSDEDAVEMGDDFLTFLRYLSEH